MNTFLKEKLKMFNKSNNFSKSNFSKYLRNLELKTSYSQNKKYNNEKVILKYRNSYEYDLNNIMNRTYRSTKNKIKKPERNYSSFYSKTTNYFDSDFLSYSVYPKEKINTKKLYTRIFSANSDYTDYRIKSSTTNYTKSRNNSSNRTKNLRAKNLYLNDPDVNFNKDIYYKLLKEKKNKNLLHFLEKIKLVRKGKIINSYLEDKYKNEKEMIEEKFNKIQITNDSNTKIIFLLKKFGFAFNKYLDKLHSRKLEERQINEEFEIKKMLLENEINKIMNKINKTKAKLLKLINIKEFILFVKNNDVDKIKATNKSNVLFLNQNLEERIKLTYNKILSKYNKSIISKSLIKDFKKDNNLNKSFIRRASKKYYSNTNNYRNKNKNFIKMKTESNITSNIIDKNKKKFLIFENKINVNDLTNIDDFMENFNKFEKLILNDLEYFVEQKREVINYKEILDNSKLAENGKTQISSILKILNYQKNKYKKLENQKNLIKKNYSEKETFNKNLYKKLYSILININGNVSMEKKIELKNIFHNLNRDKRDYNKKIHISKSLYILKALESMYLFYDDYIKRYRENIDNEKTYLDILSVYKKEKEELSYKIAKNKIENKKIERDKAIMKKSDKIYITSHMKYNMKLLIKKKKNKIKIQPRERNEDSFEQILTYY